MRLNSGNGGEDGAQEIGLGGINGDGQRRRARGSSRMARLSWRNESCVRRGALPAIRAARVLKRKEKLSSAPGLRSKRWVATGAPPKVDDGRNDGGAEP